MPDVMGYKEGSKESEDVTLSPDLWRRSIQYGWKYDLDIELVNNDYNKDAIIDDENAHELVHMDNEENKSNDESDVMRSQKSECDESTDANLHT
jgi:hypothetical protein